jgi:hypothetical protein
MPAFGLNTLGGALALYTKSGAQYPGGTVEATAGAFGRRELTFEYGGGRACRRVRDRAAFRRRRLRAA